MYSNFKEQAIEYIKQAVAEDNAGNYARAFPLYMNALEYFKTHLKYEKNPKMREAITQKFTEYLHRVEEIRAVLDECGTGASSNAGDGVVAASLKMEPKDGEENTNNFSPNPNRSFNEQAFEYVKQAVQEDDAGNYSKALYLYMNALETIITHLKFEKSPKIREAITVKFSEYVRRVEDLRAILDCRVEEIRTVLEEGGTGAPLNGEDGEVAARLKTEPKDGEGSVGGGRELEMVELNSAIVREKPKVKSAASQRLCSCFCGNT